MADSNPMILPARSQGQSVSAEALFLSFIENSNDGWCFRDLQKKTQFTNSAFCRWVGISEPAFLPGIRLEDICTAFDHHKNFIFTTEETVLCDFQERSVILPLISPFNKQRSLCRIRFVSIPDRTGNAVGSLWKCSLYEPHIFYKSKRKVTLLASELLITSPYDVCTVKEWDIIWPLVMGYRRDVISHTLGISSGHITKTLSRVQTKFSVTDLDDLTSKVIQLQLYKVIPDNMPLMPLSA